MTQWLQCRSSLDLFSAHFKHSVTHWSTSRGEGGDIIVVFVLLLCCCSCQVFECDQVKLAAFYCISITQWKDKLNYFVSKRMDVFYWLNKCFLCIHWANKAAPPQRDKNNSAEEGLPQETLGVKTHLVGIKSDGSCSGLRQPYVFDQEENDMFCVVLCLLCVCVFAGRNGEGLHGQVTVQRAVWLDCVQDQPRPAKQQGPGGQFKGRNEKTLKRLKTSHVLNFTTSFRVSDHIFSLSLICCIMGNRLLNGCIGKAFFTPDILSPIDDIFNRGFKPFSLSSFRVWLLWILTHWSGRLINLTEAAEPSLTLTTPVPV